MTRPLPLLTTEQSSQRASETMVAEWPNGEMCGSCAGRKGTEANETPETVEKLRQCIADGEPFYCHESTAVRDPDGFFKNAHGDRYTKLPHSRWRLCRAWMAAR